MTRFLQFTLLALLASCLPAAAQLPRSFTVKADVPFKFKIGERLFRPGSYELITYGTNLMAVKDARSHFIASLVVRLMDSTTAAPATKLVFNRHKKYLYLSQISFRDRTQRLEIVGEQLAIPQPRFPDTAPTEILLFNDRHTISGMKQYP